MWLWAGKAIKLVGMVMHNALDSKYHREAPSQPGATKDEEHTRII